MDIVQTIIDGLQTKGNPFEDLTKAMWCEWEAQRQQIALVLRATAHNH